MTSRTREVWISHRSDGVTELSRKLGVLDTGERWLVIVTVVMITWGFFTAGAMPASVLATVMASCFAGELILGAKAIALALLRPQAEVVEVPRFARRRAR